MSAKLVSIVADAGFFRGLSGASPRACFSRSSYHPVCTALGVVNINKKEKTSVSDYLLDSKYRKDIIAS